MAEAPRSEDGPRVPHEGLWDEAQGERTAGVPAAPRGISLPGSW